MNNTLTSPDFSSQEFIFKLLQHDIHMPVSRMLKLANMIRHETKDPQIQGYAEEIIATNNTLLDVLNNLIAAQIKETPVLETSEKNSVLVVEDNEAAGTALTKILSLSGLNCDVSRAPTGELAVALAKEKSYDLILMDIELPGIDGYEATRQIRSNEGGRSPVPIVALTAHDEAEEKSDYLRVGMNGVLIKPLLVERAAEILNFFIPEQKN